MAQQQKKKRSFKQKKQYFKQKQNVQKGTGIFVDFDEVPKDLSEEEIDELYAALPKTRRKNHPEREFVPVQGLNLNELHELAEEEGIEDFVGRNRRDALWELARFWISKHEVVVHNAIREVLKKEIALFFVNIQPQIADLARL